MGDKTRLDELEREFIRKGSRRRGGTFTATQTGARALAVRRQAFREFGNVMRGIGGSQQDFEDVVAGKDLAELKKVAKQRPRK